MCVIVDANVAPAVFVERLADYGPVLGAIKARRHRVVYGGRLRRELIKNEQIRGILRALDEAGMAWSISDAAVELREQTLKAGSRCCSNDQHVVALAQESCARVLCTRDLDLIADFKDKRLLIPRGKVYRSVAHKALLARRCSGCRP